jgi:hypothetical protein
MLKQDNIAKADYKGPQKYPGQIESIWKLPQAIFPHYYFLFIFVLSVMNVDFLHCTVFVIFLQPMSRIHGHV